MIDQLIDSGHIPRVLVRPGSHQKIISPDKCEILEGDIANTDDIMSVLEDAEAVIYTIGIIREFHRQGITYEKLHFEGAVNCMDAAVEKGFNVRVLIFSFLKSFFFDFSIIIDSILLLFSLKEI